MKALVWGVLAVLSLALVSTHALAQSPGGNNKAVQFNSSGSFAGDDDLTFDSSLNELRSKHFDKIIFASQYADANHDGTAESLTCGIQEAIDECPRGYSSNANGCVVVLPKGVCDLQKTIYVGAKPSDSNSSGSRHGITLLGYGMGLKVGSSVQGGTTLRWLNSSSGDTFTGLDVMISVMSTSYSHLEGFSLIGDGENDGSSTATDGLLVSAVNAIGPSTMNLYERIHFDSIDGTAIRIQPFGNDVPAAHGPNDDINSQIFRGVIIANDVRIGVYQSGQQTVLTRFVDSFIRGEKWMGTEAMGVDMVDGEMSFDGCTMTLGNGSGRDADYGFRIGKWADGFRVTNSYMEIHAPYGIYEDTPEDAHDRRAATTVIENATLQMYPPQPNCSGSPVTLYPIWKAHPGTMHVAGSYIYTHCSTDTAKVHLEGTGKYVSNGNFYGSSVSAEIDAAAPACPSGCEETDTCPNPCGGAVSIAADDSFLSKSAPILSASAMDLYRKALVLDGPTNANENLTGSIVFKDDGVTRVQVGMNSTYLRFYDGANYPFMSWWPDHAGPSIELEAGTVLKFRSSSSVATQLSASPTSNRTITFPDASGAVLLDSNTSVVTTTGTQTLTNKTLTSTTNVFPATTLIGFTVANPTAVDRFCGPNTFACSDTESLVALAAPALKATRLSCKATVAPGSGRSWTMTLRSGGSDTALTCTISGATESCSYSSSTATLSANAEAALKTSRSGSGTFPSSVVSCSVIAGP